MSDRRISTEKATANMDPKVKAAWIEALRSGLYAQQRDSVLKNSHGYCCLGVLHRIQTGEDPAAYWTDPNCERPRVMNSIDDQIEKLTEMNDRLGKSFTEIADWIEKNL